MNIKLDADTVTRIVGQNLVEDYKEVKRDIKKVKKTGEAIGLHSFEYKEELKALKKHKKALKVILEWYMVPSEYEALK